MRESFVVVVGVGGVGSHCAHMLVRSGVRRIRLIDFDQVTLSSLNRHATAVRADVGRPKVAAMAEFFARIAPDVQVDARPVLFSGADAEQLLEGDPSFVVDCIDNRETKLDLICYCLRAGVPFVSSLSAGGRADPSRVRVGELAFVSSSLRPRFRAGARRRPFI